MNLLTFLPLFMKKLFASTSLRQGLAVGLLGIFFSGSFYLAPRHHPADDAVAMALEEENEENDGDRVFPDRPDLAIEQENELTRDPATGTVPRERLLVAARYNEAQLALRAQQRPNSGTLASGTWNERGPSNVGGRIRGLLVDPSDVTGNTIWAGSVGGGLWKGTNATTSAIQWRNVNSFLSNLAITSIVATPDTSPQVMYCGTGEGFFNVDAIRGAGIWKSSDGGNTWSQLPSTNNSNFYFVQKLVVHPVTKDLYAATRTGLWRSQNAGATWSAVLSQSTSPASATNAVADIEIGADNTLFVAIGLIFSTDGIYRSSTGNSGSWTKLNTVPGSGLPTSGYERIKLACAPSDANRLYAAFQSSSTRGLLNIYRSSDKGDTWVPLSRPGATASNTTFDYLNGQGWYDLAAAVSPTDANLLYVGGLDLWATSNGGETTPAQVAWTRVSQWNISPASPRFVHADHHAIAFVPSTTGTANQAFFGNDGGIFYTDNAAATGTATPTFATRNNGLNVTQYYAVAMHPTDYNYFLAGAQDNGTQKYTTTGINVTTTATGGDGGFCAIDQFNPAIQFTSYVFNQYRRSLNGGATFSTYNLHATKGSFINPFDYDSRNGALYAAYSNDTCLVWTNAGSPQLAPATTMTFGLGLGVGRVSHVAISPTIRKRIYVGTSTGMVLRVDSASTRRPQTATLRPASPGTSVSCVAVDPTNENHLLVTYSNYGIVSMYESINANAASPTWVSVEGTLPDMPVRWALIDPNNPARALLATEMGVYTTEQLSGSATIWTLANSSLANTRVDMLRYRAGDQTVAAATHGRGMYTSDLFAVTPLAAKSAAPALIANVYPNPFSSQLTVEMGKNTAGPITATLNDALGRRAFSTTLTPAAGRLIMAVPAGLAPGNYVLVVRSNGVQTSRRVVKQ